MSIVDISLFSLIFKSSQDFLSSIVDENRCSTVCHFLFGLFTYGINNNGFSNSNYLELFLKFYDFIVEKCISCPHIPYSVFELFNVVETPNILCNITKYYYYIISHINKQIEILKDKKDQTNTLVAHMLSLKSFDRILFYYDKYPEVVTSIIKPLLSSVGDLLYSKDSTVLYCTIYLYILSVSTPFNILNGKDNELSIEINNLHNKISTMLDNYMNNYNDEDGYDTVKENEECKVFYDIISIINPYSSLYKPITYLNKLLVPLIRVNVFINIFIDKSRINRFSIL